MRDLFPGWIPPDQETLDRYWEEATFAVDTSVLLDLYYMTRLVRPRGLIVVDDMWMPSIRTAVAYVEKNMGLTLEPEALADGFRWRHRPLARGVPAGRGGLAVLRTPAEPPDLRWDEFVPPY